jgi:hypothetical protein
MVIAGAPITTPLRTAFDCARWLTVVEGTVVVDALTHSGRISLEELARYAVQHPGLRGSRALAEVLTQADPGSESPMETRLRLLLTSAGLPLPKTQVEICDDHGRVVARPDLAYPEFRVAVEYDGALHWNQRRADDRRRDAMRALGWTVIVVAGEDYYEMPDDIIWKVRMALEQARARRT